MPLGSPRPLSRFSKTKFMGQDINETAFFKAMSVFPNINKACQQSGLIPRNVYHKRKNDEVFRERFEEAVALGLQAIEDRAMEMAFQGIERGVYYKGEKIATEFEPSERLAELLLKANMPHKYRENAVTFNMGANSLVQVLSGMPRSDVLEEKTVEALEAPSGSGETRSPSPD